MWRWASCCALIGLCGCTATNDLDEISSHKGDGSINDGSSNKDATSGTGASSGTDSGIGGSADAAAGGADSAAGGSGGQAGAGPCGADALCVAPAPLGWTGPLAVWTGSGSAAIPDCSALGLTQEVTGYSTPDGWPPANCSACACTDSPTANCTANLYFYSGSGCTSSPGSSPTITESCTTLTGATSISSKGVGYGGEPCKASGGVATLGIPSSVTIASACSGLATGASCGQGQICAFAPPSPFESAPCIYRTGNQTCPSAYPVKLWFSAINDSRGCSACTCGQPADCTVDIFPSSASCGGTALNLSGCINVGSSFSAKANFSCSSAPSGGQPTGSVTATDTLTLCCVS